MSSTSEAINQRLDDLTPEEAGMLIKQYAKLSTENLKTVGKMLGLENKVKRKKINENLLKFVLKKNVPIIYK